MQRRSASDAQTLILKLIAAAMPQECFTQGWAIFNNGARINRANVSYAISTLFFTHLLHLYLQCVAIEYEHRLLFLDIDKDIS